MLIENVTVLNILHKLWSESGLTGPVIAVCTSFIEGTDMNKKQSVMSYLHFGTNGTSLA